MAESLPKFDIQFALAQSMVWARYREKVNAKLEAEEGSQYVGGVIEHCTRLQRMAEGLTAFATTGAQEEIRSLLRPCFEIFASQLLLQAGHVRHPEKRAMTQDEKAYAYYLHSDFQRMLLIERHPDWKGHKHSPEERARVVKEIRDKIDAAGFRFDREKPWHNMDLRSALAAGLKGAHRRFQKTMVTDWDEMMPMFHDYMNFGIHGGGFAGTSLRSRQPDGNLRLFDDRSPKQVGNWEWAFVIASLSLEFMADEFGERCLIQPMLNSAKDEMEHHPERFVQHFPTARIHLSSH